MKVAVISVVKTGRRMQSSDKFMSRPCLCLARGNPRPVDDLDLTPGDDQFAAFKNGLRVHNPRDLDGLDLGNSVLHVNRRPILTPNRRPILTPSFDVVGR